jgi:hypothetical protein
MIVAPIEAYDISEEKYFKTKFSLYAYYLYFYTMTHFKIKLQFKFRKKKNYSYIVVNFHIGLC